MKSWLFRKVTFQLPFANVQEIGLSNMGSTRDSVEHNKLVDMNAQYLMIVNTYCTLKSKEQLEGIFCKVIHVEQLPQ
jgi:hypothetical protein